MKIFTLATAHVLALSTTAFSAAIERRQESCSAISQYFKQVTTALFVVNYLRNFAHPCDQSLVSYFDAQGLDGGYAIDLICIYDEGAPIFNDTSLDVINAKIVVAWVGLFDATYSTGTIPARSLSCQYLDTSVLDELALDSYAIKNIVCDAAPCTNTTTTTSTVSTGAPTGSLSSSCTTTSSLSSSGIISTRPPVSSITGSITGSLSSSSMTAPSSSGSVRSSNSASITASLTSSPSFGSSVTGSVSSSSSHDSVVTITVTASGSQSTSTYSITGVVFSSISSSNGGITSQMNPLTSSGPPTLPSSVTYYK